jgi:hypothetical protein
MPGFGIGCVREEWPWKDEKLRPSIREEGCETSVDTRVFMVLKSEMHERRAKTEIF